MRGSGIHHGSVHQGGRKHRRMGALKLGRTGAAPIAASFGAADISRTDHARAAAQVVRPAQNPVVAEWHALAVHAFLGLCALAVRYIFASEPHAGKSLLAVPALEAKIPCLAKIVFLAAKA